MSACQYGTLLVLNSPMTVTELHHHSDALFPDERRTVPFGTGTSVFYKNIDYQFKNTTDQPVQLLFWLSDTDLCGELRTTKPFPYRYRIVRKITIIARKQMAGIESARCTAG